MGTVVDIRPGTEPMGSPSTAAFVPTPPPDSPSSPPILAPLHLPLEHPGGVQDFGPSKSGDRPRCPHPPLPQTSKTERGRHSTLGTRHLAPGTRRPGGGQDCGPSKFRGSTPLSSPSHTPNFKNRAWKAPDSRLGYIYDGLFLSARRNVWSDLQWIIYELRCSIDV